MANTLWGLETRILSITTHALIESVINYGLAVYGTHCMQETVEKMDSTVSNKAARRALGTGITIRRESAHMIADAKSFENHYIRKVANIVDRAMRAEGANAQKHVVEFINSKYIGNKVEWG